MTLTEQQRIFINNSKFGIIATSLNNQPRACVAIPEEAEKDHVIFADVQMAKTNINLQMNNNVFISFYDDDLKYCIKAEGTAEYLTSGSDFERLKTKLTPQGFTVKAAIKVKLLNIFQGKED